MQPKATDARSPSRYFLLLFGLCVPVWVVGAKFDIQLFPGFKLFQAGLAMPIIAALLLTNREQGWAGIAALLRRTYDVGKIEPRIWFLPSWSFFGARRRWRDSGSVDRRALESQANVSDADALDAAPRARDRTIATPPELKPEIRRLPMARRRTEPKRIDVNRLSRRARTWPAMPHRRTARCRPHRRSSSYFPLRCSRRPEKGLVGQIRRRKRSCDSRNSHHRSPP